MAKTVKKPSVRKQSAPQAQPTPTPSAAANPRKLKLPRYASFKLQKRIKRKDDLPSAWRLFRQALGTLARHWKLFLGISIIYGLLNVLLVQGFNIAGDLDETRRTIDQAFSGNFKELAGAFSLFMYLLGTSGSELSPAAGTYQFLLTVIMSLALIWALRQAFGGGKIRIRDAFYRGMYPLIPFLLVLAVIALELIPFVVGVMLFTTVTGNGIAVGMAEQLLWGTVLVLLALLSLYMICSSIFALYVACLPDMTPMRALRSARELVRYRRFAVVRKLIFLPVCLFVLAAVIIIPLILLATGIAPWAFFVISMVLLAVIHSYMYGFYRALL